jgi:hypothetical protein
LPARLNKLNIFLRPAFIVDLTLGMTFCLIPHCTAVAHNWKWRNNIQAGVGREKGPLKELNKYSTVE